MQPIDNPKKLESILSSHTVSVGYKAMSYEIDYRQAPLSKHIFTKSIQLPCNKNSDPKEWADKCKKEYDKKNLCILIPGKKFDIFGTRYGHGIGWYDRFLSELPKNWLRIGITEISKLTFEKLMRQSWDEPVDWVLAFNPATSSWETHETFAR